MSQFVGLDGGGVERSAPSDDRQERRRKRFNEERPATHSPAIVKDAVTVSPREQRHSPPTAAEERPRTRGNEPVGIELSAAPIALRFGDILAKHFAC